MLFNDPAFIFVFLPLVVLGYFFLGKCKQYSLSKIWLVLASLCFYGYWHIDYLILLIASIACNFLIGRLLHKTKENKSDQEAKKRKLILVAGLVINIGLLAYFKYANFFVDNINLISNSNFALEKILLPLAISFFTFQQIAYLVDCYSADTLEYDFLSYCLFVTFFPQLIAGPIVHHKEMMPQFLEKRANQVQWNNIAMGLFIFSIGLLKKVYIADSFAVWANAGFDSGHPLSFFEAWGVSLSYTFQLYYDFSGYTDMAIGAALLFNITLPTNFNSPYKALNIQDFWRRWHMTLSRFLKDYIYIPLGGNRISTLATYTNLFLTFLIGGLWHGAGWTFVVWGALHGAALCLHRAWQQLGFRMHALAGWALTFLFINFTWVVFRANSIQDAFQIWRAMLGTYGVKFSVEFLNFFQYINPFSWPSFRNGVGESGFVIPFITLEYIVIFGCVAFFAKNSTDILQSKNSFRLRDALLIAITAFYAYMGTISARPSEFLYFNF
jgi:D-alanyl-lipoteichoic acid acyltransferase DltB (MBOAT superfamily)